MSEPVKIIIADDHEAVRSGVRAIVSQDPTLQVVAEAADGSAALAACHEHEPDVALIDLRMPGTDGIWATEWIVHETRTRVLVLTTYDSDDLIAQALAAGAHGYLLKDTSGEELIRGIHHVASDRHVLDPAIAGTVIAQSKRPQPRPVSREPLPEFTDRERDVLELLAAGYSNQDIADRLFLGITTVKTHVGSLYTKTGCTSRVSLAQIGSRLFDE